MNELVSPLPGYVAKIHVLPGDTVQAGDAVVTLQSMKMEIQVPAEADGVVEEISVSEGDEIETGSLIAKLA
jgi:biotin carboxyl carrier protein